MENKTGKEKTPTEVFTLPMDFSLSTIDEKVLINGRNADQKACIAAGDGLYVIGGQEGDFMPKPGSPIFKCSRRHEVVYGDVYMLDDKMKWHTLPPMPKPDSHIEASWVVVNNSIVIAGGTTEKNPVTKRMILVGELF